MSRRSSIALVTTAEPVTVPVPEGLSPWARGVWADLVSQHEFASFELVTFHRALEWFDRADEMAVAARRQPTPQTWRATQSQHGQLDYGLAFWRTLKFPQPQGARRPGRPSGPEWSAKRKAAS